MIDLLRLAFERKMYLQDFNDKFRHNSWGPPFTPKHRDNQAMFVIERSRADPEVYALKTIQALWEKYRDTMTPDFQVSADGATCWVHLGGETPGRFSKTFGMDVHKTLAQQAEGGSQCLNCSHGPANHDDWLEFCQFMFDGHGIEVPHDLIKFEG